MIRYGVIGFGLFAQKRLVPAFHVARDSRLVALSRRDPERAREAAAKYGVRNWFTSAEDLCGCPDVDAVVVASPNACHAADTLTALRHGKPVLCEKPMAMNAAECRQMIGASKTAGVPLGVAQVFRFNVTVQRLRERIAAGDIGRPVLARAEFTFDGKGHPRTWLYDRALAGGGAVADIGVHCIDTLRWVLQDEVAGVSARATFDSESRDVDAAAVLSLEFTRGTLATVAVSTRAEYRSPLEFVGETGVLRAENGLTVDTSTRLELLRGGRVAEAEDYYSLDAYVRQLDAFSTAVEEGTAFICPGEEGLKNQLVLDAAYEQIYAVRQTG